MTTDIMHAAKYRHPSESKSRRFRTPPVLSTQPFFADLPLAHPLGFQGFFVDVYAVELCRRLRSG